MGRSELSACPVLSQDNDYEAFLWEKSHVGAKEGFKPLWLPDFLFDFQAALSEWAIETGRAEIMADCGLGKTPMLLVWAENVHRHTNKPVLILSPLAVAAQTVREATKFGVEVTRTSEGKVHKGLNITNYERLHYYDPGDFAGVVCDESSILKSFDGTYRNAITTFMRKVPYRLLDTATAAPNDYIELGTSSEALGYLGYMDMLNRFFRNDSNNSGAKRMYGETPKWRFKGHAEIPFWRWVTSWARACRKPSDLGFEDRRFILPTLTESEHLVDSDSIPNGSLFSFAASDLKEQREEKKRTVGERCERAASLVNGTGKPAAVWCHLNDEGDLLQELIRDSIQISGSDSDGRKEEAFLAFIDGQARVLITKPKIGAWGLNFQHCAHVVEFPSHSFEQYYQLVRRCWRFGQERPVQVDSVLTEGERRIIENRNRKALAADAMFSNLVAEMNRSIAIDKSGRFTTAQESPQWL